MPKPILVLLVVVFLITGLAATFLDHAGANTIMIDRQAPSGPVVERCVLQPVQVHHPDHGAVVLVLRPTC